MNTWLRTTLFLLAFALTESAYSQPQPRPDKEWNALTPAQKQEVKQRFELWKRMPEDQKEALLRRHASLVEVKSRLEGEGTPGGTVEKDDAKLRRWLEKRRDEILKGGRFSPEEIEAMAPDEFVEIARARAMERIERMESEGFIDAAQAQRLRDLPAPKLGRELRKLDKKRFLSRPPRAFLELPEAERQRITALPPDEFQREIKRVVPPRQRPPAGPGPARGDDAQAGRGPALPPDPRFLAARRWVEENLPEEERAAIRAAEPFERRNVIRKLLRARAENALKSRGDDPKWIEEVDLLPGHEREIRWIQLIDPAFEPPPPPLPGPGRGSGNRLREREQ